MKLRFKREKYIRHSESVARHNLKRLSSKRRKKKYIQRATARMSREEREEWKIRERYEVVVKAPSELSFLKSPDSVVSFVAKLEKELESHSSLYVNMRHVVSIDYPTIASLLAVLHRANKYGNREINGNMPRDLNTKKILLESGFLFTLFSKNPDAGHKHDINADHQLFTLDTRDLTIVQEIVDTVSACVASEGEKLPGGLYTTLGELMDNTATHAAEDNGGKERWWVSINYERSQKKVTFVFIDYGVGIFTSLGTKKSGHHIKKTFEKAKKVFGADAAGDHLKAIVTRSARKAYKLKDGRGEGIYGIYQAMERDELKKLHIISNNAFGNVSDGTYCRLNNDFSGTLYYWEIQGINQA